jgi:hypothetical protein
MILLPAIDLMSGEVVRLRQGKADQKTVYSSDPAAFARQWEEQGGDYLHIVDLMPRSVVSSGTSKRCERSRMRFQSHANLAAASAVKRRIKRAFEAEFRAW